MSYPAIPLNTPAQIQHEVTFNQLCNAMSAGALFGVRQSKTQGLRLTLYGGNFPTATGPVAVADSSITLTASATNYISVDVAGVVSKVTAAPTGWPGPMPTGAIALYQLTVGADAITSGTCYLTGPTGKGPSGQQGATGPAGAELWSQRKRSANEVGGGATNLVSVGFAMTSTVGQAARSLASTSLRESIPYASYANNGVGGSTDLYSQNFCYLGNASGRGGFDVTIRWCYESPQSSNGRRFMGLYNTAAGVFGNVEPDTILNTIGIGSKAGDANLSIIHNDGSGTATMATLGANFPALSTNNVYELNLVSVANSGTVTYTLTCIDTGNVATGTISSDLPANTQFLGLYMWSNTGSQSSTTGFGFMQAVAYTRY